MQSEDAGGWQVSVVKGGIRGRVKWRRSVVKEGATKTVQVLSEVVAL